MTTRNRLALRWLLLLSGGALLGMVAAGAIVLLAAAAGGALTTPPGAWVTRLTLAPGVTLKLSVPGLARLAISPLGLAILDRRQFGTRFGTLRLARVGDSLEVTCAPCRIDLPQLAAQTVHLERAQLRLARAGTQALAGELVSADVRLPFTARLRPERIDIDWQLPPTGIAALYRLLGSVIPEAHLVHIDGRIHARGSLRLPQRRAQVQLALGEFSVRGLGTEVLADGPITFACADADGRPRQRRLMPGEGRWISPTQSGALLAAAVLAAEDQRFHEHEGFDRAEIASVLASFDGQAPTRGASTITQQLARTLFTGAERSGARKLRELLYAVEMERTLDKAFILALYLNTVDWGPGVCGADAAASTYFGKRPQQLSPLEAAWLAGILRNPRQAYVQQFLASVPDTVRAGQVLQQMRTLPRAERERWTRQSPQFVAPAARSAAAHLLASAP